MAFDPSEYCYECGDPGYCGCPADINTQDLMRCSHCNGEWWRQHGETSTTCLHYQCRRDGSTVKRPAKYAPRDVAEGGEPR